MTQRLHEVTLKSPFGKIYKGKFTNKYIVDALNEGYKFIINGKVREKIWKEKCSICGEWFFNIHSSKKRCDICKANREPTNTILNSLRN